MKTNNTAYIPTMLLKNPAITFKADQATEYVILFWLTFHLLGGRA